MEDRPQYDRYGWQSDLDTFTRAEPGPSASDCRSLFAMRRPNRCAPGTSPFLGCNGNAASWRCGTPTPGNTRPSSNTSCRATRGVRMFIVLERGCVAVLELKGALHPSRAALDQALGYARDLSAYHAACVGRRVIPVLLNRGSGSHPVVRDGVHVVGPEGLDALLEQLADANEPVIPVRDFLAEDAYAPLPSIIQAARDLFHRRQLPMIKRARAATDPALQYLSDIAREAARTKTRHLVLLSGIPGSGKTLVGLQLVHSHWLDDLAVPRANGRIASPAVYLTGNGPLVLVLQYALKDAGGGGKAFVQPIKNYVEQHSRRGRPVPPEHLIVFDEAQRAHDAERVAQVHKTAIGKSEPEHLVEFCERIPEWCVLVALVGTGQAIHVGEEVGIPLWEAAIRRSNRSSEWTIHGAPVQTEAFRAISAQCRWDRRLSLDTEIRFHLTPKVHEFVAGLNEVPAVQLSTLADELHAGGHRFLITRDLDAARAYLHERYADAMFARYGLLASSKDKLLPAFSVDNTFQTTKRLRVGPWYNVDPTDQQSCCQLETVATEFSSQGLELDGTLLAWGSDLIWKDGRWSIEFRQEPAASQRPAAGTKECLPCADDQRPGRHGDLCSTP